MPTFFPPNEQISAQVQLQNALAAATSSPNGIPGLPVMLANGGWQVLTDRPFNVSASTVAGISAVQAGAITTFTNRVGMHAMFPASHIVLVYGNIGTDNSAVESPGRAPVAYKAALQKAGSTVTDETGSRVPVTFNSGKQWGDCAPDGLLYSDPIPFDVGFNELFYVRSAVWAPGPSCYVCYGQGLNGGTSAGGLANGDGQAAGDVVMSGTTGGATSASNTFGPLAILGFSPYKQKSVAIVGDSLCDGSGDGGMLTFAGGYLARLMRNQTALATTQANYFTPVANFPFVWCARFGGSAATFVNRINSYKSVKIAELASTVIWEYGINDFGSSTAAVMEANALTAAAYFNGRGKKFIACTLTPKTTSTDNWTTVGNQTVVANEARRVAYNTWLRDTSSAGFIAQAGGTNVANVWDVSAIVEVDSVGRTKLNGGFWPALPSQASLLTGSITGSAAKTGFADTGNTATTDQWRAYCLFMTSGAANGQGATIRQNSTVAAYSFATALSTTPSIADTYTICQAWTVDGLHGTAYANQQIVAGLNTAANLSMIS